MVNENTNWGQSVASVVIKDNKVLLARHTYNLIFMVLQVKRCIRKEADN